MSNSVSKFIGHGSSTGYNSYFLVAQSSKIACNLSLGSYSSSKSFAYLFVSFLDSPSDFNSVNLTKDQITHLLSLDCPDAFIAYALTLCPCPPEFPSIERSDVAIQVGKDGGNPLRSARSYSKKEDLTYLDALKGIKAQIEFLNKCAFDKSILTSDEHFALLGIEEELQQLIHFDPVRPVDDGLPFRYDHFNCFELPDNLE